MRSGCSNTKSPKSSCHTTPGPASSPTTARNSSRENCSSGHRMSSCCFSSAYTQQYFALVLELHDGVFKHLENARRRCPGNIRPRNGVHYRLAQLLTASPGVGTGLQILRETTLAPKPLDALPADHQPATIAPASY